MQCGLLALAATALCGCGSVHASQPHNAPIQKSLRKTDSVLTPVIQWRSVSVGPEVLLDEGTSISTVLAGPKGRVYYGTENPLGDSSVIGWYNFSSGVNRWQDVPARVEFPLQANINTQSLNISQASYWGSVDLVVSGAHTVWYRHWGYVGGWTSANKFVPGDYAIPGPTVTAGRYTASVYTSFSGTQLVRIMNLLNRHIQSYPLPSSEDPVAIAFGSTHGTIWLLTPGKLWSLNTAAGTWTPVAEAASGDFFVAMGHLDSSLWVINADGGIARIRSGAVQWEAHLPITPLSAEPDGVSGLWIASLHHLSLWIPGQPLQQWLWPTATYPAPASHWPTTGSAAPPDWPPIPHLAVGARGTIVLGYGPYIGEASVVAERSALAVRIPLASERSGRHESR